MITAVKKPFRVGAPFRGEFFAKEIPVFLLGSSSEKFETRDWRPGMPLPEEVFLFLADDSFQFLNRRDAL